MKYTAVIVHLTTTFTQSFSLSTTSVHRGNFQSISALFIILPTAFVIQAVMSPKGNNTAAAAGRSSFSYSQSRESLCFILLNSLWWGCCALTPGRSSPFQWWSWWEGSGWRSVLCNTQVFNRKLGARMRSCLVVRASDCQCRSRYSPGFDPSILRHSGIWGAADEAVLNTVYREKIKKNLLSFGFAHEGE